MDFETIRRNNEIRGFDFSIYQVFILTILSCLFFIYLERVKTEYVLVRFTTRRVRNQILTRIKNKCKEIKIWNLRIRGISFIHSFFSSLFSILILLTPEVRQDPYSSKPYFWLVAASFSMGYFLWDLTIILREWNQKNDSHVWFFHGFVSLLSIAFSFLVPEQPLIELLSFGMLTESSTILLSIRYCYHIIGDTSSISCKIVSLLFLLVFFVTRNVILPYGLNYGMYKAFLYSPTTRSKVRVVLFFPLGLLFNLMNAYWLYKVIRNVFNPKDQLEGEIENEDLKKSQLDEIDELQIPDCKSNILLDSHQDSVDMSNLVNNENEREIDLNKAKKD
ncbi:hypothetical protein FG379_002658 [Cryptosporidium bovis]|uniref:uncharacterized protein n=1 Tax=Cryptosporidium bovis TaxID=310047 RepID=UPI00351A85F0|nr:hypothetical protein FG379_002658 [Cryptosporidium bovis]